MHYNEFQAVKLARQLIENDEDDGDGDDDDDQIPSDQSQPHETASCEAADSVRPAGDSEASRVLREDFL